MKMSFFINLQSGNDTAKPPNARHQARGTAGAKNERRLFPVAWMPLLGPATPPRPALPCSLPVTSAGRRQTQGFDLYSMRRNVTSLVVVGLTGGHSI